FRHWGFVEDSSCIGTSTGQVSTNHGKKITYPAGQPMPKRILSGRSQNKPYWRTVDWHPDHGAIPGGQRALGHNATLRDAPQEVIAPARGLPEVTEGEPFGPGIPVFKVAGKVFAILQPEGDPQVTLKCEPSLALELRAQFPSVIPGYPANKKHWNSVLLDGTVPADDIRDMVEHSYSRVGE